MSKEILKSGVASSNLAMGSMQKVYDGSVSLLDILKIFITNKKSFLLTFFMVLLCGSAIIFLQPIRYDVVGDIYAPYSYVADGAIYYPLGSVSTDSSSHSLIAQSEFGRFFSLLDNKFIDIANSNSRAEFSLLTSSGDVYRFNDNGSSSLPISNSAYLLHIDGVSFKMVDAASREVSGLADQLVKLGNSQLVEKKEVITKNIPLMEQQLAQVSSFANSVNHSHGNMFSADPSKSIAVWLDESNAVNQQKAILANWHGFSRSAVTVIKDPTNNSKKLVLLVFMSLLLGIFAVVVSEVKDRLKCEKDNIV